MGNDLRALVGKGRSFGMISLVNALSRRCGIGQNHLSWNAYRELRRERIELMGNRRIESATWRARISWRSGDPYSIEVVRRDVQALWNT